VSRGPNPPSLRTHSPIALRIPDLSRPLQLYVHGEQDRFVSQRLREVGVWEPFETSLILRLLRPGAVFVDVGANIGYFSVLAASVVGAQGAVFAFEPDPENFRLLRANAELNGLENCITAVEAALAEAQGEGRLFLSADNLGDHQVYAGDAPRSSVPIALLNGSQYLAEHLQRLDLLKVDTQGAEFQVMAGLLPLLQSLAQTPQIIIELTPHSLRAAGSSGRALLELLATLGQPMWIIDHIAGRLHLSSAEELALWCDNWDQVADARGFMNILVGPAD
jgi:FkbM family methyltransferase